MKKANWKKTKSAGEIETACLAMVDERKDLARRLEEAALALVSLAAKTRAATASPGDVAEAWAKLELETRGAVKTYVQGMQDLTEEVAHFESLDPEACPGCERLPGDGKSGCDHPDGCGADEA